MSANVPDADVALRFFADPLVALRHHRGLTHSIVFSPALALAVAGIFLLFSNKRDFKALWAASLIGILLHIGVDLITPFGTQIFAPVSDTRYSLDWMFIVDPWFTGLLILTLVLARFVRSVRGPIQNAGAIVAVTYIALESALHSVAYDRVADATRSVNGPVISVSALPQPLSIFRWSGMIQTDSAVYVTFFPAFGNDSLRFTSYPQAKGQYVDRAASSPEVQSYLKFGRHPWVRARDEGDLHVVEYRDLQFAIDGDLIRMFGMTERALPFALRCVFRPDGEIGEITFDGRRIR